MRVARARAVILGLAYLDRVAWRAQSAPVEVTGELRAVLSLLALQGGGDLASYRELLEALPQRHVRAHGDSGKIWRSNAVHTAIRGIHRDLGAGSPELDREIIDANKHGQVRRERAVFDRYRLETTPLSLFERFDVAVFDQATASPLPEIAPSAVAWVVNVLGDRRKLQAMTWGYARRVASLGPVDRPAVNVVTYDHPLWDGFMGNRYRRCIVPFESFRQARRWIDVGSTEASGFAGIWRPTEYGDECAVLTCEPNAAIAAIGETRMPVILMREDEERWLEGVQWNAVGDLLAPLPSQLLRIGGAEPAPPPAG